MRILQRLTARFRRRLQPIVPRRAFLRGMAGGFLWGAAGVSAGGRLATAATKNRHREEIQWLHALADAIVPRDHDPGAVDARVPERLAALLRRDPRRVEVYRLGYALVNRAARRIGAESFAALGLDRRIALLEALADHDDGQAFIERARTDVFILFYASETGQGVVDYRPPNQGYLDGAGTASPSPGRP